jgi:uncharacterized protein YjeT (DUF2065 family)
VVLEGPRRREAAGVHRPQSSSASRFTAGAGRVYSYWCHARDWRSLLRALRLVLIIEGFQLLLENELWRRHAPVETMLGDNLSRGSRAHIREARRILRVGLSGNVGTRKPADRAGASLDGTADALALCGQVQTRVWIVTGMMSWDRLGNVPARNDDRAKGGRYGRY